MRFKKMLVMLTFLLVIGFISPVLAQDEDKNDGLARLVLITPKEGQSKALEEAITKFHHYMADKEGAWRYQWYSIISGPNTGKYFARSGGHNWADFDAEHDWDAEVDAKFASDVQPYIADADSMITQADDELGIWPDSMEGYTLVSVTNWHIKPGQGNAFYKGLKKIDGILKAGNWPSYYAFSETVTGGHGNTITLASPRKNFADMAPKDPKFMDVMKEAMGEEEATEFLSEWSSTYKTGDYYLVRYRPKLSDYGDGN